MKLLKVSFRIFHHLVSDISEYFARERLPGGNVSISCDGPCKSVNITVKIDKGAEYIHLKELSNEGTENEKCVCKEKIGNSATCAVWECLNVTSNAYVKILTIYIRFVGYHSETGAHIFLQNANTVFPGGNILYVCIYDRSYC